MTALTRSVLLACLLAGGTIESAACDKSARQPEPAPQPGPGQAVALFERARALEGREPKQAVSLYKQAARQGSDHARLRLHDIYSQGLLGEVKDYAESLKWWPHKARLLCG